jgi:uncharacterized cupin superfamily protein
LEGEGVPSIRGGRQNVNAGRIAERKAGVDLAHGKSIRKEELTRRTNEL